MKHIFTLLFACMLFGMYAQDPNITIEIEELPIEEPALTEISNLLGGTPTTYRVFAAFPDNYELLSIYGVQGEPLSISSTAPLFQSPVGGPTTLDVDPFEVANFPSLTYDSWLTIGDTDSIDNNIAVLDFTGAFDLWDTGSNIVVEDIFGSSIFAPSDGGGLQNNPDPNGRVLIGQFTTTGVVNACLNFQIRKLNADGTIFDPPGPEIFEDFRQNVCFTTMDSPSCLGDLDDNLLVNAEDLLMLLADFGCDENCVADLDGDEVVNVNDLLIFLTAFGAICAE